MRGVRVRSKRSMRSLTGFFPALFVLFAGAGSAFGGGGMNPADFGLPLVDNVYNRNGVPNNGASAMCFSCHSPSPGSGNTSHFVAHYSSTAGAMRATTTANIPIKERTQPWTQSGGMSKYGQNIGTNPSSDNATTGEIICESCHNLLRNMSGGNNLIESSLPTDARPGAGNDLTSPTTTLCEGCHVSGTLQGHHPMTGETVSGGAVFSTEDSPSVRGYVNPTTEMGGAGSKVRYPAANTLPCISCHGNGHTGYTGTGARILHRGYGSGTAPGGAVAGADVTGTDRQHDIDPTGVNRLITNYTPLCDACHKTDD